MEKCTWRNNWHNIYRTLLPQGKATSNGRLLVLLDARYELTLEGWRWTNPATSPLAPTSGLHDNCELSTTNSR
eukprot:241677-Amphidinium_carterae.1